MTRFVARWSALILGLMLPIGPALAQPPRWAVGTTDEDRARAQELLVRGNEHLVNNRFTAALEVYQLAIRVWDHPSIRANMAVCFINLGRLPEAYESVELALRYGTAPFDKAEVHAATLNYKKLLERQIGFLRVRCTERDAAITLDGRDLLLCPGERRLALLPGRHQVIGQKPGFVTTMRSVTIRGGLMTTMKLRLIRVDDTFRTERLWNSKFPRGIAASGAGLVLAGAFLKQRADETMRNYDQEIGDLCVTGDCRGWSVPGHIQGLKRRAIRQNRAANVTLGLGAVIGVTGLFLLYANRERRVPNGDSPWSLWMGTEATPAAGLSFGGQF